MNHGERAIECSVKRVNGRSLLLLSAIMNDSLGVLDVDVAKVIVPVLVYNGREMGELAIRKSFIDPLHSMRELVQDPLLSQRLLAGSCTGCV